MSSIFENEMNVYIRNVEEGYERFQSSPVRDPIFIEEIKKLFPQQNNPQSSPTYPHNTSAA